MPIPALLLSGCSSLPFTKPLGQPLPLIAALLLALLAAAYSFHLLFPLHFPFFSFPSFFLFLPSFLCSFFLIFLKLTFTIRDTACHQLWALLINLGARETVSTCFEQQGLHQCSRDWKLVCKGNAHNKFIGRIVILIVI